MTEKRGQSPVSADRVVSGVVLLNAGLFLWVVHDAMSKSLLNRYSVFEILLIRSAAALPIVLMIMRWEQGHLRLHTQRFWALVARGGLGVAGLAFFLFGLKRMPLADTFAIFMSAPLLVAALAGPLLGEPATARQWAAVLVGFIAVLFMIRPGGAIPLLGAMVMLAAVACFALGVILTRALGRTESAAVITVFVMAVFVVAGALVAPFVWTTPSLEDLGLMSGLGVLSGAAMYCTIYAYRDVPPAVIAPFQYTSLVWAVLIGYAVWADVPDPSVAGAAVVVVASGIYVLRLESRQT